MAVAQWVRRWNSDHSVVQAEGSSPDGDIYQNFSTMIFISVLLGLIDISDIVMLGSGPNSCCQQNLKCFDMPLWVAVRRTYVFTLQEVEKICRTLQSHVILVWTIQSKTASCFKPQVAIFQLRSFYKLHKGFT